MEDKKIHILLVEDDEVDVMNVRRAFKKNNIVNPLYLAANGLEALHILRQESKTEPTSNEDRDKVEAYNLNVAGYILKPVTFSNFVEVMATLNKYWMLSEIP
ncbi:MAG: response regulator [Microcoleus sp. PH2017_07_MST_O_A]|nr:response regulator [Microcoleus sp. PH2017_07_MST_O_A]